MDKDNADFVIQTRRGDRDNLGIFLHKHVLRYLPILAVIMRGHTQPILLTVLI